MDIIFTCKVCDRKSLRSVHVPKIDGESYKCCHTCVEEHDHPGKFEAHRGDEEKMALALVLESLWRDGCEDEFMWNEGWGSIAMIDRFLIWEDTSGFVDFEEFDDVAKAQKRFDRYFEEGWGADENDAYIYHDYYRGWKAVFEGKELNVWTNNYDEGITRRRCLARIRLEMIRTGYYPNVWEEGYHGELSLIKGI
jgi:hypothetical protein